MVKVPELYIDTQNLMYDICHFTGSILRKYSKNFGLVQKRYVYLTEMQWFWLASSIIYDRMISS